MPDVKARQKVRSKYEVFIKGIPRQVMHMYGYKDEGITINLRTKDHMLYITVKNEAVYLSINGRVILSAPISNILADERMKIEDSMTLKGDLDE